MFPEVPPAVNNNSEILYVSFCANSCIDHYHLWHDGRRFLFVENHRLGFAVVKPREFIHIYDDARQLFIDFKHGIENAASSRDDYGVIRIINRKTAVLVV